MKIAIFHNCLDNIGGAEVVTLTLAKELGADIYTTNISPEHITNMGFAAMLPNIHSIGRLPRNAPFRQQLALWKFRHLNLGSRYDVYIISGDWAMSAGVNHKPNMWYIHSPLNELWAYKNHIEHALLQAWQRPLYNVWVYVNRILTRQHATHIEQMVCNSENTKQRVQKYYNRSATVVHPPIDTKKYAWKQDAGYWLSVNRLIPHKAIEVQLEAFAKLPNEQLIIVGSYEKKAKQFEQYKRTLENMQPANVRIINWVEQDDLITLYTECKGLIATARDEDFGMSVVEAMAAGKPVIARREGGYKETVIHEKTGILLDQLDGQLLADAITSINQRLSADPLTFKDVCQKQAAAFDKDVFIDRIRKIIQQPEHL